MATLTPTTAPFELAHCWARIRFLLICASAMAPCACSALMGPVDAYVRVEGRLQGEAAECKIRFYSIRKLSARAEQRIPPGPFVAEFLYHGGERKADFSAQLSCAGSEWRDVGPEGAFNKGWPVQLGVIVP